MMLNALLNRDVAVFAEMTNPPLDIFGQKEGGLRGDASPDFLREPHICYNC